MAARTSKIKIFLRIKNAQRMAKIFKTKQGARDFASSTWKRVLQEYIVGTD
jgi:hypothetical protein